MPHYTKPAEKIEYDFVLHFNRPITLTGDTLQSPASDDFGNNHVFDGVAVPIFAEQRQRQARIIMTSIYYRVSPLIAY